MAGASLTIAEATEAAGGIERPVADVDDRRR